MKVDKSFRADHTDQIHPTQQLTLIEFYVRYFLSTGFKVSRIDDRVNNSYACASIYRMDPNEQWTQ